MWAACFSWPLRFLSCWGRLVNHRSWRKLWKKEHQNKWFEICVRSRIQCIICVVCAHMYIYKCIQVCVYVCMYVCMYVWMYVCTYVFMYVCMYVRTYACMYVCIQRYFVFSFHSPSIHRSILVFFIILF